MEMCWFFPLFYCYVSFYVSCVTFFVTHLKRLSLMIFCIVLVVVNVTCVDYGIFFVPISIFMFSRYNTVMCWLAGAKVP